MISLDEHIRMFEKLADKIAIKYANKMMTHGASLYSSVKFSAGVFGFNYGPSTSGMSKYVALPLSLLYLNEEDLELEIAALAAKYKAEQEAERKANTCATCGHSKIPLGIFYS